MKKQIKLNKILFLLLAIFVFFVAIDNQKSEAATVKTTSVSKLGKVKNGNVIIYKNINNLKSTVKAGTTYTDRVYYVKKQAVVKGVTYYSINTNSSTTKYVGWVKAADLQTYNHKSVNKTQKKLYINGNGQAFSKPWGGSKDLVYKSLTNYKFAEIKVNLTESVGNNTWYRGTLNGKTVWVHSNFVVSKFTKSDTSRLGQLKSNAKILSGLGINYKNISNTNYLNQVLYIKQQANFGNDVYYLISTQPSKTKGLIGWVKSTEITTYTHKTVDKNQKSLYLLGKGAAYSKPWGGSKDLVFNALSTLKFNIINVNLTESVGSNIWYRGIVNGKTVWIHINHTTNAIIYSDTSRLGQLNSNAVILSNLTATRKTIPNTEYLNKVFYIKQQAVFGSETYYLISTHASKTNGIIGWVKSTDMTSYSHKSVDNKQKMFYINGDGYAYSKPWGGSKESVLKLSDYKGMEFFINLTEDVGGNLWFRGTLNGKTVWIHRNHLVQEVVEKTTYDLTFQQALNYQKLVSPQTDKYRNSPAYISSSYVSSIIGETNASGVKLRTSTKLTDDSNVGAKDISKGTKLSILDGNVTGDSYNGSKKWLKVQYNNQTLYIHSSLVTIYGTTTADVNVRASASETAHKYGVIKKGTQVTITELGASWHTIKYNTWRNATDSDVSYYLNPANFVNDKVQKFQFLDLRSTSGVTAANLNTYLKGKGIFDGRGQAFIDAGKQYGINELYLVAHAMLETGNGNSVLAKGYNYKGTIVYNMYGIEAFDSCPLECGAKKAYEAGWTTPEKAIIEGAKFVSQDYILNKTYNQNTLYKMRWNPEGMVKYKKAIHQYATDIGWASKQVNTMYNLYNTLNVNSLKLDVPVYK